MVTRVEGDRKEKMSVVVRVKGEENREKILRRRRELLWANLRAFDSDSLGVE